MEHYLLGIDQIVDIYGFLLTSINTIWNLYVFVFLGIVGWIVARAHELSRGQKKVVSAVFTTFNLVVIFYFFDAYKDMDSVRNELIAQEKMNGYLVVVNGISGTMVNFNQYNRFFFVLLLIFILYIGVLYLVWSRKILSKN